jgi:hypothetical protein
MVYGDGKIYVGEATGRWYALQPTASGVKVVHQLRLNNEEILGSPIISHGRIYLPTNAALYCLGTREPVAATSAQLPLSPAEPTSAQDAVVAHLQVVPVEALLEPGGQQAFTVRAYNANGQFLRNVSCALTVEGPGSVASGVFVAGRDATHATALVTAKLDELTSTARVRIVPPLPWSFDFAKGQVPPTWVGAAYRHQARELDGESVLVKISTIPKGTRSQSWMGPTDLHDYTILADFRAAEKNGKTADIGLINQRYTLAMNSSQELQLRSWTSRLELRFAKTIPFTWKPDTWYTMKFQSENAGGKAVLRGKVWPRGEPEPSGWTIEASDLTPNTTGSPGLFGNATDAEFYIDNVKVHSNPSVVTASRIR